MSYQDYLSGDQFPKNYRSAYKRAQEIGKHMPPVTGNVAANTDYRQEKRGAMRLLARSSVPGEHLKGLSLILTGSRHRDMETEGFSSLYDRDEKTIHTSGSLSGRVPANRGRRAQANKQHELLHELGHHQEPEYPDYSIARSEALAENYAVKHRSPESKYTKSHYDTSVIGVRDPAATEYRKTRRAKTQPGEV